MAFAVVAIEESLIENYPGEGAKILEEIISKGFSATGRVAGRRALVVLDKDHMSESDVDAAVQRVLMAVASWED